MKDNDIVANEDTYNILIDAYRKRDFERAEEYYDVFAANLTPSVFTYNFCLTCETSDNKEKCKHTELSENRDVINSYIDYEESASLNPINYPKWFLWQSQHFTYKTIFTSESEHNVRRC